MRRTTFFLAGLAVSVAGLPLFGSGLIGAPAFAQDADAPAPAYEISAETVRKDLELVVTRTDEKPVWTGSLPPVAVSLRNTSESTRHSVVTPGDGSRVGWREPHIRYEVERLGAEGEWVKVETQGIMRCGNYDANWLDEIETLEPGAAVKFEHYGPITWIHDLVRPGRYRIRGVYTFSETSSRASQWEKREDASEAPELGEMAAYAPYALHSRWLAWTAIEPLRVTIVRTGTVVFGTPKMASEVIVARVENVSAQTLTIQPDQVSVRIDCTKQSGNLTVTADARDAAPRGAIRLAPGEHVPLFGPNGLTSRELEIVPRRIAGATAAPAAGEFSYRITVSFDAPKSVMAKSDAATLRVVAGN